jgi:hypothetical protein
MRRLRRYSTVLGAVIWVGGAGCGLRSNPLDEFDGEVDLTEGEDPGEVSSCAAPKDIPAEFETFLLTGQLRGSGSERGPCGRDDGPEAVHSFSPAAAGDVSVRVLPEETSFSPTIRVERDTCGDPTGTAELCAADFRREDGTAGLARHFHAQPGFTYFVTIDSPAGTSGSYGVELRSGPAPLEQCAVHRETITYARGGTFSWINDFGEGYGRVQSRCGAPGRENMFRLSMGSSGWVGARVTGNAGFVPVLSLRGGCSMASERECSPASGSVAAGEWFLEAGEHYLVVDNASTAAGGYELFVEFY